VRRKVLIVRHIWQSARKAFILPFEITGSSDHDAGRRCALAQAEVTTDPYFTKERVMSTQANVEATLHAAR